ncbi:hypothetical protein SLS62_007673 [Diatrype stigma]|uniref:J domain-containing protein n=1 Tax=Diatrype stigma TaxID=117547 RepID=A0AAN9UW90_9PEZI
MPQWDKTRNYYADIELPVTATSDEIKRQYRKLVLQWHPDRNRGNERQANIKFQSIQSAYEILVDERLRREYDAARGVLKSRYPMSSGVRGNPWQDVGKQYPRPPTRNPQPNTQPRPSGAQRYATDFGGTMPRAGGHGNGNATRDDQRNHYTAWQNMRSSGRGKTNPPPTPGRAPTSATRDSRQESSKKPEPTYVPPRTASQKQKAEAAFGSRKTGYVPNSPGLGDEPPVTSKNYFTTRHTDIFAEASADAPEASPSRNGGSRTQPDPPIPDPLARFRDSYMDKRQSFPYHSTGGEKIRLDENIGLGRTASTRAPPRKPEMPGTFPRPRSSSTASINVNIGTSNDDTPDTPSPTFDFSTSRSANTKTTNGNVPFQPQPSNYFKSDFGTQDTAKPSNGVNSPSTPSKPATATAQPTQSAGRPSVYDPSFCEPSAFPQESTPFMQNQKPRGGEKNGPRTPNWLQFITSNPPSLKKPSSTSDESSSPQLLPFEEFQRREVERLVRSRRSGEHVEERASRVQNTKKPVDDDPSVVASVAKDAKDPKAFTNSACPRSFKLPVDRNTDASTSRLARDSTENINTSFVQGDPTGDWRFTAGSPVANDAQPQSPSMARPIRRPIAKPRPVTTNNVPTTQSVPMAQGMPTAQGVPTSQGIPATQSNPTAQTTFKDTPKQGFSAGEWSEKIGSEHFVPPLANSASTSPTRRSNSRKTRPPTVKATAGTAGMVDDDENEGWRDIPRSQPGGVPVSTDSPLAMDIDSPPPEPAESTLKVPQTNGARNIPVEPTRPDWRAGDVNAVPPKSESPPPDVKPAKRPFTGVNTSAQSKPTPATQFPVHNGGSEDTEEFRTTLSDLKKTEPFIDPTPTGLKSFADMKSTLPFESRASEQAPIEKPSRPASLEFPVPPVAPRLPQTAAKSIRPNIAQWRKYTQDFFNYMDKWEVFNAKVVDHFSTRQKNFVVRRQQYGLAWLGNPQDSTNLEDYLTELQQDQEVQKKWVDACNTHGVKVREFQEFRDKVK